MSTLNFRSGWSDKPVKQAVSKNGILLDRLLSSLGHVIRSKGLEVIDVQPWIGDGIYQLDTFL